MFTGIIESVGRVSKISKSGSMVKLTVINPKIFKDFFKGASLSVSGVCLTLLGNEIKGKEQSLQFEVSGETLSKSNLGDLKLDDPVNLERSVAANGRFEGHIVLGHVDTTVRLENVASSSGGEWIFKFGYGSDLSEFLVEKGSLALNGISLTVFDVEGRSFKSVVLPYTYDNTNLCSLKTGCRLNCELDVIGKYVRKMVKGNANTNGITPEFLKEHGFV